MTTSPAREAARPGRTRRVSQQQASTRPYGARIESIGCYMPAQRVTSDEVVAQCGRCDGIDLERATGIVERRFAAPGEDSLTLSLAAIEDCLARSRFGALDVDLIVFCGIAKYDDGAASHRFEPGLSLLIRERIGARNAMAFDAANACAGMLTGVHIVKDFVERGAVRRGMVVSAEFISHLAKNAMRRVTDMTHAELASLTLGDAAAAVILERTDPTRPGIIAAEFETLAEHVDLCTGSPCPDGPGAHMLTRAKEIHAAGIAATPSIIQRTLAAAGLRFDEIDHVVMHQTAVRAIERCSTLVQMLFESDKPKWVVNVDQVGNTASTSHFVALARCLREQRFAKGERILLITQASGLVVGAIVFTVDELVERYGRPN